MNLPTDLRDFRPSEDEDAFIILSPGDAFICICVAMALGWLLASTY